MIRIHKDKTIEHFGQWFGVSRRNLWTAGHRQHIVGNFAASIVLFGQIVRVSRQLAALFPNQRENMLLFEQAPVIVLSERAEQLSCLSQRRRIHRGSVLTQLGYRLETNEQGATDDAVLSHQILGRSHFRP